jgi:hypothetical protein
MSISCKLYPKFRFKGYFATLSGPRASLGVQIDDVFRKYAHSDQNLGSLQTDYMAEDSLEIALAAVPTLKMGWRNTSIVGNVSISPL